MVGKVLRVEMEKGVEVVVEGVEVVVVVVEGVVLACLNMLKVLWLKNSQRTFSMFKHARVV